MATVSCAVCRKQGPSREMKWCGKCELWVHYSCAGGGILSGACCPGCGKKI
jgi:hypothetical protein